MQVLNLKTISKTIGSLLMLEATLMTGCLAVALYYRGTDIVPFILSIIIATAAGFGFRMMGRDADNLLSRRDAYFVVTISWVIFSLIGSLPFLIGSYTFFLNSFLSRFLLFNLLILRFIKYSIIPLEQFLHHLLL